MASLIWLKATVARLMMDSTLFLSPLRCFPGLQADKRHTGVLSLAAEAEAVNGKDAFDVGPSRYAGSSLSPYPGPSACAPG